MILARLLGTDDAGTTRAQHLNKVYSGSRGPLSVRAGGVTVVYGSVKDHIQHDLGRRHGAAARSGQIRAKNRKRSLNTGPQRVMPKLLRKRQLQRQQ